VVVQKHQKCISGAIPDGIEPNLDVPRVPVQRLAALESGKPSRSIASA
jgi:hypothetical protein